MQVGRGRFGPALLAWADAATADPASRDVLQRLGRSQVNRYASLGEPAAQRFLTARLLLAGLIAELTEEGDVRLTTTCERCGGEHGRPRLERAPVAVSVSYADDVVAVAAVPLVDASAVGVDIERVPSRGAQGRLTELAPLFAPGRVPDMEGWTLLEAALKADGRGVAVDMSEIRVGERGSGRLAGSCAVRIPGRIDGIDAATIAGPSGFVLSSAVAPPAPELRAV